MGFGELSAADKESYYREVRRFARLFGLGDELLPADWAAFTAYCARMLAGDELAVGQPARETAAFLLSVPGAPLAPVMPLYARITAGMLPPRLREEYDLPSSRADELVYQGSLSAVRRGWRHIPVRLRLRPEYVEARRRLAGRPRPDRVGRALQVALLRGVRPRNGK
jgi:uncharacterized protein (DUF2236 family)